MKHMNRTKLEKDFKNIVIASIVFLLVASCFLPVSFAQETEQGTILTTITFNADQFSGSSIPNPQWYYWNFGDGAHTSISDKWSEVYHSYWNAGSYTVQLKIWDTDGIEHNFDKLYTIEEPSPGYGNSGLSPFEKEKLTEKAVDFCPILYVHPTAGHNCPGPVSQIIENSVLKQKSLLIDPIIDDDPSLDDLRVFSGDNYYLKENDHNDKGDDKTTYVHLRKDSGRYFIQYFFFYYYNDGFNDHEGDWELVQLSFDLEYNPIRTTYSQHESLGGYNWGEKRNWCNVEKFIDGAILTNNPIVYVSSGDTDANSHANYFYKGDSGPDSAPWYTDDTSGCTKDIHFNNDDIIFLPNLEDVLSGDENRWLQFAGNWGEYGTIFHGPPGPVFRTFQNSGTQYKMWTNPYEYENGRNEDGNHESSNVILKKTMIIVEEKNTDIGVPVDFTATLFYIDGYNRIPLENKILSLYIDSFHQGDSVTDEHGQASFTYTPLISGDYDIDVVFKGLTESEIKHYTWSECKTILSVYPPSIIIQSPTTTNPARVGDPANPNEFLAIATTSSQSYPEDAFEITIGDNTASYQIYMVDEDNNYYFIITPPTQENEGAYDLEISIPSVSTYIEPNAVIYSTGGNVDVMTVIDRSGSMSGSKIAAAKTASKLFVDLMKTNDMIGVVSYSSSATVNCKLSKIIDGSPQGVLSPEQIASLMVNSLDDSTAATMVAIALAESSGDSNALGDYDPGNPYSCNDYTSIGLWQIHMPAHYDKLEVHTGSTNPCIWSDWLSNPDNNADIALEILATQGLTAWSTYNNDAYLTFLATAQQAVANVKTGVYKEDVKNIIDKISAGGMTAIGRGLQQGYNQLITHGDSTHPWSMILLSDGYHNTGIHPYNVLPSIQNENIRVFTIGLGASVDQNLLQYIADNTGGEYYYSPGTGELTTIYQTIAGVVKAESTVKTEKGTVNVGETVTETVYIDSSIDTATFTLNWESGTCDLELKRPDDTIVLPSDSDVLSHAVGANYETFTITDPADGTWVMEITRTSASSLKYTVTVTASTDVTFHLFTDKDYYYQGEPIHLMATLSNSGNPIIGADVDITIEKPDGSFDYLTLFDDGYHDDGVASDGVYTDYYTNTDLDGSYNINGYASGTIGTEEFTREATKTVHISGIPSEGLSVTPPSWDTEAVYTGEHIIGEFTIDSLSSSEETVTLTATDLINDTDIISAENILFAPESFEVPAGGSITFYTIIFAPEDAESGNYTGDIILTSTVNSITIPVKLWVVESIHPSTIDIDPDTLNLKSKGNWITCYIELDGYDVVNINISTILLSDNVSAEDHPTNISDYDNDGIPDLMVKFDRQAVQDILEPGENVAITVTGKLFDETRFEGIDYIRVV